MANEHGKSPFTVIIRDGGLECEVTVRAGYDPESTGEALCFTALRDQHVELSAEVSKRVGSLITLQKSDSGCSHSFIIAEGVAPQHGKDGRLAFHPKFDPDLMAADDPDTDEPDETVQEPSQRESGVDHHDRSAFALIKAGELIGILHAPTQGVDGRSVTGDTIVAKQGKPIALNIDGSVDLNENGKIKATTSGVLQVEGRKIRVLQKLDIRGSVDFSTGNINFSGDVVVAKSVKDGFRIKATHDVLVRGLVEAATINAGRDLQLHGGVACRQKGVLVAERDVEARYLNECDLKAGRNLTVEREIIHAKIAVGADLIAPNCTIIGGTMFVTGECEVAEIGSERSVPTMLTLGKEREANQLSEQAGLLLQKIGERLGKSQTLHDQFVDNTTRLTPTQAEQMTELQFEIGTYSKLRDTLSGAVVALDTVVSKVSRVSLTVQKQIWRGVTIVLDNWEATIEKPIKGPFRITCNHAEKPILTDLLSDSSVELSTVACVRSRIKDEGADEAIAA